MTAVVRRQFGRYALIGILSNAFCYLVFLSLLWARISPVLANAGCYVLGLTLSYVANRSWTFQSTNRHRSDMLRFGGAYGVGFLMSVLSMAMLVRFMAAPLAQVCTIGITAVVIFCALQLLRFGHSGNPRTSPA